MKRKRYVLFGVLALIVGGLALTAAGCGGGGGGGTGGGETSKLPQSLGAGEGQLDTRW